MSNYLKSCLISAKADPSKHSLRSYDLYDWLDLTGSSKLLRERRKRQNFFGSNFVGGSTFLLSFLFKYFPFWLVQFFNIRPPDHFWWQPICCCSKITFYLQARKRERERERERKKNKNVRLKRNFEVGTMRSILGQEPEMLAWMNK